ncbi:MAG: cell cycle transcriptional regulator TrcR [Pseudomonadota bacterium]|nr:cell cycle transcriptional regulator TrcR [Pseudomonadota bacterium]
MSQVLMPKATAVWLIDNTTLTFDQISNFCGLHPLEVQSIADGEVAIGIVGYDPITNGQITQEEIDRCSNDPNTNLEIAEAKVPRPISRTRGPRYTPVARRQDRPDAIEWLLHNFPELSDGQISKLIGTTKQTINSIRDRTHWNISNIKRQDPVALELVSREDLTLAIEKAKRNAERLEKTKTKTKNLKEETFDDSTENLHLNTETEVSTPQTEVIPPTEALDSEPLKEKNKQLKGSSQTEGQSPFSVLEKFFPEKEETEQKEESEVKNLDRDSEQKQG